MRIGGFLTSLLFLFSGEVRKALFQKPHYSKTGGIFFTNQAVGGLAFVLQNFAVSLVPLGFLSFINALEGTKYVFVLIFSFLISMRFPKLLKEEASRKTIIQKAISVLLIISGLIILSFV